MSYPIYCLFAYKSNSVDTCRGCVMERFDSDYVCEKHIDKEFVLKVLENIIWRSDHKVLGESKYDEIHVFVCTQFKTKEEWFNYPAEDYKYVLLDQYSDEYKSLIKEATSKK